VISSRLHIPSTQYLNLIFQEINVVTHSLTSNCEFGVATICDKTDLNYFAASIRSQVEKIRGDVPKISINQKISIELAVSDKILVYDTQNSAIEEDNFEYLAQMIEDSGFYVFVADSV
jgi:hypothetical protein